MDRESLKSIVEGLVFASSDPLSTDAMAGIVSEATSEEIQTVAEELEAEYRERARGFILARVAGGYQFRSLPTVAPWIQELKKVRPARLSRASLETLCIIAYNQPVTRARIEQVRGVESSSIVRSLVERGLIEVVGKKDIPGRPLLYGTTDRFLEVFGLPDLASLPPLPEAVQEEPEDEEGPSAELPLPGEPALVSSHETEEAEE